ncbi:hypothetical protein, partial [Phocaeicola plebeius]|uniref:hypothetical protein n=1 Tax=Phocaeicola plebeius TaxID=310297 RepID=UPI004024FFFF
SEVYSIKQQLFRYKKGLSPLQVESVLSAFKHDSCKSPISAESLFPSTSEEVLQYCIGSTPVLSWKYYSTP